MSIKDLEIPNSYQLHCASISAGDNIQLIKGATAGYILESDSLGNGTWVSPASVEGVTSITGTSPAISITGTASVPNIVATGTFGSVGLSSSGAVALTGPSFRLSQSTASTAYVSPVTIVTCNGTSGIISLTGFSLNNSSAFVLMVNNSAITPTSVVICQPNVSAVIGGVAISCSVAGSPSTGQFQSNIQNIDSVPMTGTFMLNFIVA